MDSIFYLCCLLYKSHSFSCYFTQSSNFFWRNVTLRNKICSQQITQCVGINRIGLYSSKSDCFCLEWICKFYFIFFSFEYFIDIFPNACAFNNNFSFFWFELLHETSKVIFTICKFILG